MVEKRIWYFDTYGKENTEKTLELARKRADELGIKHVVMASSEGVTAVKSLKYFNDMNIVVVSSHYGFLKPGKPRILEENRRKLEEGDVKIIFATHVLAGIERSIDKMWGGIGRTQLVASLFKMFGEGVKVSIECAVMAADAGAIPVDKEVIAMGGTYRGADTAMVLKPAHSNNFFDLEIHEIICMQRTKPKLIPYTESKDGIGYGIT
jgi:hypothetical protein